MSEAAIDKLTPEEQDIYRQITTTELTQNDLITAQTSPDLLWKHLQVTGKIVKAMEDALAKLKPYIGRLLMVIREYPSLFQEHGYRTFDDFMTEGAPVIFKMSRPQAYNCMKIARELGFMSGPQLSELGLGKANALATIMKNAIDKDAPVEMIEEKRNYWVQVASSTTIQGLKAAAATENVIEPGELDKHTIAIIVDTPTKDLWDNMSHSPEIAAYCETSNPGFIFRRMMEESLTEWTAQAVQALQVR